MSDQPTDQPQARRATPWSSRLALVLAVLALAAAGAQWLGLAGRKDTERARGEEIARTQRRISALEDRIGREREDLNRLAGKIGAGDEPGDTLSGRIIRLEDAMAKLPGGERVRFLWRIEQAEYFMRIANAQENLAGDSASALTALRLADDHLREAADPRLSPVRKLVASEIAALRAVPRVDTEGLALKLGTLAGSIDELPRAQTAPAAFNPEPVVPPADNSGLGRALQALRNAFLSIVSIRRTDAPMATLLSDQSGRLLTDSLRLELQMARLALLRGESAVFSASLATVRHDLGESFDISTPEGAAALATLDELARAPLPASLPDISGSLTALLRIKERELTP
jgi:uroporphyrin-3 C-methyltransferase